MYLYMVLIQIQLSAGLLIMRFSVSFYWVNVQTSACKGNVYMCMIM